MSDGLTEARRGSYFMDKNQFSMMKKRKFIFDEIEAERKYQDEKWGVDFDEKNTLNDWWAYINHYFAKAAAMGNTKEQQRKALIKVAALGVAALERFDENDGHAPRHYDDIT